MLIQRQHRFKGKFQVSTYIEDSMAQWLRVPTTDFKINGWNPDGFKEIFLSKIVLSNIFLSYIQITLLYLKRTDQSLYREKGRDLTQSCDKSPYTGRNVKMTKWQQTNIATKSSISQQLRPDLGRSVGATTATNLMLLNGLRVQR